MIERDLERDCVEYVEAHYGRFAKWTYPGVRGVPDRILLLPDCPVVFVELKNPSVSLKLKGGQRRWRKWLIKAGFIHWTVNDYSTFVILVDTLMEEAEK